MKKALALIAVLAVTSVALVGCHASGGIDTNASIVAPR